MSSYGHNKPLQILIAEDDPDDQFIFETAFREIAPDAVLHFFYTSQALIHYLVKVAIQHDPSTFPDIIIGNMKLPFFELKDIAEIRTYRQFERIPVYVFAEGFADVRTSALALGANGFYHKPNSLHIIKDILLEIVSMIRPSELNEQCETSGLKDLSLQQEEQEEEEE